ncbi:MAG TPA: hypothetical protein VF590_22700 [Isosphaeraceae bacterium]|jgi:hypothetical protein
MQGRIAIWPSYYLDLASVFALQTLRRGVPAAFLSRALLPNVLNIQNYLDFHGPLRDRVARSRGVLVLDGCVLIAPMLVLDLMHDAVVWTAGYIYRCPAYLWHGEVGQFLHFRLRDGRWMAAAPVLRWACAMTAYLAAVTATGEAMGWLVERPVLAVRDRLFPSRGGPLGGPEAMAPASDGG